MSRKICLRCDWEGGTKEAACPSCGVPLYVVGAPPSRMAREPARRDHVERNDDAPSPPRGSPSGTGSPSWSEPNPAADPLGSAGRSARPAGAVVAAVLVLVFTLGAWLASREGGAVVASPTATAGRGPTPADGSPTPVASPSPTPSGVDLIDARPNPRSSRWVGDVRLAFRVPTSGWERFGDISINKSIVGPQGAEAMIFWTAFPDGDIAEPCADLLSPRDGRSAADLAAAIATAPGVELVTGPSDVAVGGRGAKHVVLVLRERVGCDPGVFFMWQDKKGGALWPRTPLGSTIRAWTVDVDGTLIFIAAATNKQADADLVREVEQIVRSIRLGRLHV